MNFCEAIDKINLEVFSLQTTPGPSASSSIAIVDGSKTIRPFSGYLTIPGPKSISFLSLVDLLGGC
jgi:hypothetical protein